MAPAWDVKPLGMLLRRPPSYGIGAAAVVHTPDLPTYIRITDITEDGRFAPDPRVGVRHPMAATYYLEEGDLVFARTGASVGKSYRYRLKDGPLVYAGFLIRITPDADQLDPVFLSYFVQTKRYWDWVKVMSVRSGQPGINGTEYASLPVHLPPITEQRLIAETLADIDDLLDALTESIWKKQQVLQGTMQELLSGRTRLSGFDSEWREVDLSDHVVFLKTTAQPRSVLTTDGPVKYLHYGDIHTSNAIRLDARREAMPRLDETRASRATRLQKGDVVFVDASEDLSGVGKSVEISDVPDDGVVAGLHTIAARFDKNVLTDDFKAYLQFSRPFRNSLLRLAAGTKVFSNSRKHIASIRLSLPDVDEQVAITNVLSQLSDEVGLLRAKRAKMKDVRLAMLQQLMRRGLPDAATETA